VTPSLRRRNPSFNSGPSSSRSKYNSAGLCRTIDQYAFSYFSFVQTRPDNSRRKGSIRARFGGNDQKEGTGRLRTEKTKSRHGRRKHQEGTC
jgi:hypothetical protein